MVAGTDEVEGGTFFILVSYTRIGISDNFAILRMFYLFYFLAKT